MVEPVWFWQRIVSPHMASLVAALAARGVDVTYVAERPMSADRAAQGWEVPDLGAAHLRFAPSKDAVKGLVAQAPADSIHICQGLRDNGLVSEAQRALARRTLRQWVVMETVEDSGWRGALRRRMYEFLLHRGRDSIQGILATGHSTRDWLVARGAGADRVFPFTYFLPDRPMDSASALCSAATFRVLFVGQFIRRKRLDQLIEALARSALTSVELAVIGAGPLERELHAKAEAALGDRLLWLGRQSQHAIPGHMAAADCLVLPSRYDGWGAVVSEALMAGTPAICSDRCGAAGVVRASGRGGVFPAGDIDALAALLRRSIDGGRPTPAGRADLARWARCLGAEAGADYLAAILRRPEAGGRKPSPPWEATVGAHSSGAENSAMKIVHVVPHIDAEAAGPSYSVPRLSEGLAARGHGVTISCLAAGRDLQDVRLEVHRSWPIIRRFAISPDHTRALRIAAGRVDIVHNHSLWSMVNVGTGLVVPGQGAKLVTSPRGTLSKWALGRNRKLKQLLWHLQKHALSRADLLHATSSEEYDEIRALGFNAPVAIVPNGIDLPELEPRLVDGSERTLLFLSRVHPTKGIENLLDAWTPLEGAFPDWRLIIVGPGEPDYLASLQQRAFRNGSRRVLFFGPVYGDEKSRAFRMADLFVLPTHSENFGMVVAEALAHECPAVVSRGAPWKGLVEHGCGWWVPNDTDSLQATLEQAMSRPPAELREMGRRGREWMARDFGWDTIACQMETTYQWLLRGGGAPAWVRYR